MRRISRHQQRVLATGSGGRCHLPPLLTFLGSAARGTGEASRKLKALDASPLAMHMFRCAVGLLIAKNLDPGITVEHL